MNDQVLSRLQPLHRKRSYSDIPSRKDLPPHRGRRIAIIGTFVPRKCGIATFTKDLADSLTEFQADISVEVFALDNPGSPCAYEGVAGIINVHDREACFRIVREINDRDFDAVWVQHEYGIYGDADGALVCEIADRLAAPIILTPHTVLTEPRPPQERILKHLIARSSRVMVMNRHSRDLLISRYGASPSVLDIIEHGAPDRPFGRQEIFKAKLGLAGRTVLSTFGLIGPGKGLEAMIAAMPLILERHPRAVYRIIGVTHPELLRRDGETYRQQLVELAEELGVKDSVQWEDRFLETEELLDQLEACDIYVTPYTGMQQSTSGTLSYAVALGKAVVSTPYIHARELLADEVGRLVEPGSSIALADTIISLLDDPSAMRALQRCAYAKGRDTIWPRFAEASARLIEKAVAPSAAIAQTLTPPDFGGVLGISDSTGILQHSIGLIPDRSHGYCLDDNARALMLMNVAGDISPMLRMNWSMIYASFIQHAWNEDLGLFRNFMGFDRSWSEEGGSEDSNGRAFWALGQTANSAPSREMRHWAITWYDKVIPKMRMLESPRAIAFAMLGAAARLAADPDHSASMELVEKGARILSHILDEARRPDWLWFEVVLGYDNPRLSQALIEAGIARGRDEWIESGLETLEWITKVQCAPGGNFRPIGSESFGKKGTVLPFDQQPLEAQAAIEACASAYRATQDARWLDHAERAWRWFFGANDRGVEVADLATGRCRDGVTPRGVNENSGAESTLAFHLSHYSMVALESQARRGAPARIGGIPQRSYGFSRIEISTATS